VAIYNKMSAHLEMSLRKDNSTQEGGLKYPVFGVKTTHQGGRFGKEKPKKVVW